MKIKYTGGILGEKLTISLTYETRNFQNKPEQLKASNILADISYFYIIQY